MNVSTTVNTGLIPYSQADEIDTPHLCTCTPSQESSFPVPLPVVLTHVLAPLGPPTIGQLLTLYCIGGRQGDNLQTYDDKYT